MTMSAWSLLLVIGFSVSTLAVNTKMKEVFSWKEIDFAFPNEAARQAAILTGSYISKNNLPLGLDVWRNRVFVTVPRWKAGVAASLAYAVVDPDGKTTSPRLVPYPSWEANQLPTDDDHANKTSIVSVFRVQVDACDRLWVMDTGLADITGNPKVYFKPQILIYDLHTDQLVKKHTFKDTDLRELSFFANINVDADKEDNCENAFAYVPDLGGYGLIVYSLKDDESWRIKHNFFHFDPLSGDFNIGGVNFQWTDGIFSFALSKRGADGYKTAYFHALASVNEFAVSTRILRNKTIASDSYFEYRLLGSRGPNGQSSASFMDTKTGVVFYTQVNRDGIGCWNSNQKTYTRENQDLVTADNETFIFPNDIKIDREDNLWALTDKLPVFIYRELDPQQVNYRIFKAPIKELIKGTVCDTPPQRPLSVTPTTSPQAPKRPRQ